MVHFHDIIVFLHLYLKQVELSSWYNTNNDFSYLLIRLDTGPNK